MNKVCISCPQGCQLEITVDGDEIVVTGNRCRKGIDYARQEMLNPVRTITTTVATVFDDFPRLPVRTESDVDLDKIFDFMREINLIKVDRRLKVGDIVADNLLGLGVRLIATTDI
ncbi:MAG: DUF1667 domain-containing protein [Spirochaetales bacterium]|nr:DUF1667 domain-containing protein [Spirochaetales bacterium]